MKEFNYTIKDPAGLHARPAGSLVKKAKEYKSRITLEAGEKSCDAVRLMGLMAMCIKCGTSVNVRIEGEDEDTCANELEAFFNENM